MSDVINNRAPIGICGTGAMDALSIMLRAEIIDEESSILTPEQMKASKSRMMKNVNGEWVFVINRKEGIYINQKDVQALMRARAAIAAGINTLLREAGVSPKEVSALYIAGAPNFSISPKTLNTLGIPPAQIKKAPAFLENAAGTGAGLILLNSRARADAEYIATVAQHLHICNTPSFKE